MSPTRELSVCSRDFLFWEGTYLDAALQLSLISIQGYLVVARFSQAQLRNFGFKRRKHM